MARASFDREAAAAAVRDLEDLAVWWLDKGAQHQRGRSYQAGAIAAEPFADEAGWCWALAAALRALIALECPPAWRLERVQVAPAWVGQSFAYRNAENGRRPSLPIAPHGARYLLSDGWPMWLPSESTVHAAPAAF